MNTGVTTAALIAYFAFMVGVSIWYGRRVKTDDDFVVAGRQLPRMILTGTLLATWTGAGTIVGRANFSYTYGPLASIFYSIGAPLGIVIMYLFLAARIRALGKRTVPEIIELRYGRKVRLLSAGAIIIAYIAIASEQVRALGYLLNMAIGVPELYGEIIGLTLVIVTAVLGGILSLARTDAISALLITIALFGGVIFSLIAVGGFSGLAAELPEQKMTWSGGLTVMQLISFGLPTLMLFLGDQNMYQRFGSARDPSVAKKGALGFFFGDIVFYAAVLIMASCAAVLLPGIAADTAILRLATDSLPAVFGVAMLVAATAFMITTGNSYLLSTATNLVQDLYASLTRGTHSSGHYLLLTRLAVVALGVLAFVIGKFFPSVLEIQLFAYTMYGAVITPSLLAVFVTKRVTPVGAAASMLTGIAATITWEFVLDKPYDWNSVMFSLPISVAALVIGSALTKPLAVTPEEEAMARG